MLKMTFASIHRRVIYHRNAHKHSKKGKEVTAASRQRRFPYELLQKNWLRASAQCTYEFNINLN